LPSYGPTNFGGLSKLLGYLLIRVVQFAFRTTSRTPASPKATAACAPKTALRPDGRDGQKHENGEKQLHKGLTATKHPSYLITTRTDPQSRSTRLSIDDWAVKPENPYGDSDDPVGGMVAHPAVGGLNTEWEFLTLADHELGIRSVADQVRKVLLGISLG